MAGGRGRGTSCSRNRKHQTVFSGSGPPPTQRMSPGSGGRLPGRRETGQMWLGPSCPCPSRGGPHLLGAQNLAAVHWLFFLKKAKPWDPASFEESHRLLVNSWLPLALWNLSPYICGLESPRAFQLNSNVEMNY